MEIGDILIVNKYGCRCTEDCGYPCIGEKIRVTGINYKNGELVVVFDCDGENCSKFNIEDFEKIKKVIKQFGIANFINSIITKGAEHA